MVEYDAKAIGRYMADDWTIERSTCVFVRQDGTWRCVLTHLSRLAQKEGC
jgi:hypothetical protein